MARARVRLLEELQRSGVKLVVASAPEADRTIEDELLRQLEGLIAEYERALTVQRTCHGKLRRVHGGNHGVVSSAPYGYRYIRQTEFARGYWEIDEREAKVVREIFLRYTQRGESIAEIVRWLSASDALTRTGKRIWDRSTVWRMLRNPAYQGRAAYSKNRLGRHGEAGRPTKDSGRRHGRIPRDSQSDEEWTLIVVPALVSEETFSLAQMRLERNRRFASRGDEPCILVCRYCGRYLDRHRGRAGEVKPKKEARHQAG